MRKRNSVKQLNRVTSHRNAMMKNMAISLFDHERIVTTRAKSKVLKSYAEKLITRARANLDPAVKEETKLHNKREVLKHIADRDIASKLFDVIAPRYVNRNGGYTRIIHLPERKSDASQMSIIELVDRTVKPRKERIRTKAVAPRRPERPTGSAATNTENMAQGTESEKKEDGKWYSRFMKKKKGE
jgi:large subunit ribosomal protein L17